MVEDKEVGEVASGQDSTAKHLLVLIHGFWGNPTHLNHLRDTALATHPQSGIRVLMPASNRDNNTYDGIEVGAERITQEILQLVDELKQKNEPIEKFSIVGYSLGGLIGRYVVGLLLSDGFFETVQPLNFTTFASPHLGVRSPKVGYQVDTWNWLGSNLLSTSGQQLYLTDNFRGTGRPLLDIMADPASTFLKGLRRFKRASVYANVQNDPAVPYYSAAFDKSDPYVDIDAVDLHYLEAPGGKQAVILDPAGPVSRRQVAGEPAQSWMSSWTLSQRTRASLPFYAFAATVLPLGIPVLLANAGYQTYTSSARVRQHETGDQLDLKRYRVPFLEETTKLQDSIVEEFTGASGEDYLPTPPPERAGSVLEEDQEWPSLALTDQQFAMIGHLDTLGIIKYPCYIKIRRAHAAIIVRVPNPAFDEGKIVCQHWVDNFLV